MSLEIGQVIAARYRVDAFIGKGGIGEVYKVWDNERAVFLALKLLREDLAEDKSILEILQSESQTLASLQHPCIVRFYGFEQRANYAYILMDYVDGSSLRNGVFRSKTALETGRILKIMRPICSALYYAHQQGLVHGDVKPTNILIQNNGTVQLADFGIARLIESATLSRPGAGDPAYMAPEQVAGANPVPQTDIYALGVILYELVTGGGQPFNGERAETTGTPPEKVRWEQINLAPVPPRKINPELDPQIEKIILKCLEKDPAKRYSTTLDLLNDLTACAGEAAPAPPLPAPLPKKPATQQPGSRRDATAITLWGGLVVILAVIIFALIASGRFFSPPPAATSRGPAPTLPGETAATPVPAQPTATLTQAAPAIVVNSELLSLVYHSANDCLSIRYPAGWAVKEEASSGANTASVSFASHNLDPNSSQTQLPDNFLSIMIGVDSIESMKTNLPASVEFTPAGILGYVRDRPGGFSGNITPTPDNYHILQDVQETTLSGYPAATLIIEVTDPNGIANQKIIFDLVFIMTDFNQAAVVYATAAETGWAINKAVLDQMLATLVVKPGTMPIPTAGPQPAPTAANMPPPASTAHVELNLIIRLTASGAYLRSGPNLYEAPTSGKLATDLMLTVLGKTSDDQWFLVETPDGKQGWIYRDWVDLSQVDLNAIGVMSSNPAAADTPAPLPTAPG